MDSFTTFNLNYSEINSLYNIAGYIISSIKRTSKTCDSCVSSLGSLQPIKMVFTRFSYIKCYKKNTLFFCNEIAMDFFIEMESIFRKYINFISSQNIDVKLFFINKMKEINTSIEKCHNIKYKIISRFTTFRLKIISKKKQQKTARFASKSLRK